MFGNWIHQRCPHCKSPSPFARTSLSSVDRFDANEKKNKNDSHFDRIINIIYLSAPLRETMRNDHSRSLQKNKHTRLQTISIHYSILLTRVTITILQLHWRFRCVHNFFGFGCSLAAAAAADAIYFSLRYFGVSASARRKKRENHWFH